MKKKVFRERYKGNKIIEDMIEKTGTKTIEIKKIKKVSK